MLHLRPDLVRMEHATDFRSAWIDAGERSSPCSPRKAASASAGKRRTCNPAGALGDATAASAETGAAILEHAAARLVQLWDEVRRLDVERWMREGPAP